LAENLKFPLLSDVIKGTIVRFSISSSKYVLGIIVNIVETNKPYTLAWNKKVGFDKEKNCPVVKQTQTNCSLDLVISMGDQGIFQKPR